MHLSSGWFSLLSCTLTPYGLHLKAAREEYFLVPGLVPTAPKVLLFLVTTYVQMQEEEGPPSFIQQNTRDPQL